MATCIIWTREFAAWEKLRFHGIRGREIYMEIEENEPRKRPTFEIGMDLSNYSVDELSELTTSLQEEIVRISQILEQKKNSLDAANSIFKTN